MIDMDRIPHFLKYMGSKREILDDISNAVDSLETDSDYFCDLFAGTAVVSCAMADKFNVISNDIQQYSSVFAKTYFGVYDQNKRAEDIAESVLTNAQSYVNRLNEEYPLLKELFCYSDDISFDQFCSLEMAQQNLMQTDFLGDFTFFTKCYSGTYWSLEQCEWIDALRKVAEDYRGNDVYYAILSSIIYAMSYSSQSTGHFAQFRKITEDNYKNILAYRKRNIAELFFKKFCEVYSTIRHSVNDANGCLSMDYRECLKLIPKGTIVYADPPYSNVHYSRFYHAVETLVKYDNPKLKYNGRYRTDRHQSPFDQAAHVREAFKQLFEGVKSSESHLILSYSDNGMLTPEEILEIGSQIMGAEYECSIYSKDYSHMKMGRSDEYKMDVKELLINYKRLDR